MSQVLDLQHARHLRAAPAALRPLLRRALPHSTEVVRAGPLLLITGPQGTVLVPDTPLSNPRLLAHTEAGLTRAGLLPG